MKLEELKKIVDKTLNKLGDMDVVILISDTENCGECGQPKDRKYESVKISAEPIHSIDKYNFWIEGETL